MAQTVGQIEAHIDRTRHELGANLAPRVQTAEAEITDIRNTLQDINRKLGRLFWDVDMHASQTEAHFGTTAPAMTYRATSRTLSWPSRHRC